MPVVQPDDDAHREEGRHADQREYGEADAWLHLPPPSPASVLQEALQEQFAMIDYTVKANARAAMKWFMPKR